MKPAMRSRDTDQNELGAFLRARRSELSPSDVDLPEGGTQRRVAGLRREEVAQLAGVGLSWYTWLEQGRDIKPSPQVLDALARVLRLDRAERTHLYTLARVELPLPAGEYPRSAPPELSALVEALVPNPAYLLGPRTDVLAWNRAASGVIGVPAEAPYVEVEVPTTVDSSLNPRLKSWVDEAYAKSVDAFLASVGTRAPMLFGLAVFRSSEPRFADTI